MLLIIAYGNDLRRDDGAGLRLAEMIEQECRRRRLPAKRISGRQLLPELSPEIARADIEAVLFVDTRAVQPTEVKPIIETHPIALDRASPGLGHQLSPTALLLYVYLLYGRQPPAWLVTAPGLDFSHGEGLSPVALQALHDAGADIAALLDEVAVHGARI
jgi:hydrogenase maturation protease